MSELLAQVRAWKEERYDLLRTERREALDAKDDLSAANAVGGMLELLELESFLIRASQTTIGEEG